MIMGKENRRPRPRAIMRPSRRSWRGDVRHHSPHRRRRSQTPHERPHHYRTQRRSPTPRVRLLSSITVVPPKDIPGRRIPEITPQLPPTERDALRPSSVERNLQTSPELPSFPSPGPWETPADLEVAPTHSTWRNDRNLIPTPKAQYSKEFRIVPGEAYEPVPQYINRDVPWKLTPIEIPVRRKVHHYRSDINDPRMHDLRVEVVPMEKIPDQWQAAPLQSPRRSNSPLRASSGPMSNLMRLLDQIYGRPRPSTTAHTESPPVVPSPSEPTHPLEFSPSPALTPRSPSPPSVPSPPLPAPVPGPSSPPVPSPQRPSPPRVTSPGPSSSTEHQPSSTEGISESLAALLRIAKLFGTFSPHGQRNPAKGLKRPTRRRC